MRYAASARTACRPALQRRYHDDTAGSVVVNYDNGQSRPIAQVPVITFNAPDSLQRQNGAGVHSDTAHRAIRWPKATGEPTAPAGSSPARSRSSNVDIATQFSKLIVAQQAYSANSEGGDHGQS